MKMLSWRLAFGAGLCVAKVACAQASVLEYKVQFAAHGFFNLFDHTLKAPIDPASGLLTVKFDRDLDQTDSIANIKLLSLDLPLDSAIAFNYTRLNDELTIGGIEGGVNTIQTGSNDFFARFRFVSSAAPVFEILSYYTSSSPAFTSITGSVTSTVVETAVPETATWTMMLTGVALAGIALRRRIGSVATGMVTVCVQLAKPC